MLRAISPMPVADGHDELACLSQQQRHEQQTHDEMQTVLKNQALAIEIFLSKWQMAAFVTRTRSETKNFVHAEN